MKVQPYIPPSVRSKKAWQEVSDFLGIHPVVARLAWMDYFASMELKTWMEMVLDGRIKKEEIDLVNPFTQEELDAKQESYERATLDRELSDTLHYRLKQLIEIGDEIVCHEDKFYLSGQQYMTRGKRYPIKELKEEGISSFCAITSVDVEGERNYCSNFGIRSLWRNGTEIWNWSMAYLELFMEQNPDHPQIDELRKGCEKSAYYHRTGEEEPSDYIIKLHKEGMENPVYRAGYTSEGDVENPYKFPRELSDERSRLAVKRVLSNEDKERLAILGGLIDKSDWGVWSSGYHAKRHVYLKNFS